MPHALMCKRIIDGKTYNTETAVLLAGHRQEDDESPIETGTFLYKTRFGAFFLYQYQDYGPDEDNFDAIQPLTAAEAQAWLEKNESYNTDLIERLFGKMPEAGSQESRFTLRMPDTLRDQLAERAKANGRSLNAWIIRCLETYMDQNSTAPGDIPPMGNMVGSNKTGWRSGGT